MIKGRKARSMLILKVKDSGKGISQDFLKNSMFKPFTQEDSLTVGTGLGLSIVRHIIQDLGGEINFTSEQGVGTEATVKLPLLPSLPAKSSAPDIVEEVKVIIKGKMFHLEGFDRYPDLSQPATGILSRADEASMLSKSSMHFIATRWLGMRASSASEKHSDVVFLVETDSDSDSDSLQKRLQAHQASGVSIAIVLSNSYPNHNTWASTACGAFKILHVHQPYVCSNVYVKRYANLLSDMVLISWHEHSTTRSFHLILSRIRQHQQTRSLTLLHRRWSFNRVPDQS